MQIVKKPEDRLITLREVVEITGLCRSTIYEQMEHDFPRRIQISKRAVRWSHSEIMAHIASRPRFGSQRRK